MKHLSEIQVYEKEKWNSIVQSFPNYEVFYLNEYVSAFMNENLMNGIPILLLYENREDKAINVVFKRDVALDPSFEGKIPTNQYFDLITPYGYGGFVGTVSDFDILNYEYNSYCINRGYICEFVRFNLFSDYYKYYDGEVISLTHNVIRNLELSMDDIWMNFKHKVRKNVKKGIKNNLEIVIENTGEYLKDFLEIYYSTMERCDAENEYYFNEKFYNTLMSMKENIMYFHVLYAGKVISTELVIYGSENVYSYLGGTNQDYFNLRPNDFLKFEIIKWGYKKGYKNFVLGGGCGSDDGIFQYKAAFAPDGIVKFYIGKKILDKEKYSELCTIRNIRINNENIDKGFFPKYRM